MLAFIDATEFYYANHDVPVLPIAHGKYLDNLGKILGFTRGQYENDDVYRKRSSAIFDTGG